ncbi:MAG: ECF-type sigma factor [Tepidisphaeraceae bacterium]
MNQNPEVTLLIEQLRTDGENAARKLLPLIYDELRQIASREFRGQRSDHTLQPTVLVHEAFLKLVDKPLQFQNRSHFLSVAAIAMRQVLVNHARTKNTQKRGSGDRPAILHEEAVGREASMDVLALNDALEQLAEIDDRKKRIVEMRFFGGMTVEEIAEALDVSKTTVESDWRAARAWLSVRLSDSRAE